MPPAPDGCELTFQTAEQGAASSARPVHNMLDMSHAIVCLQVGPGPCSRSGRPRPHSSRPIMII